ncbi:hypothetical protein UPYG_G00244010 [Umbra pygmaea]|uniref:C-type lectin domain-containing protein n=1 Tax=Umbra pygmaea TaxID=75934 RepID=A0ABD0X047_UMBPY
MKLTQEIIYQKEITTMGKLTVVLLVSAAFVLSDARNGRHGTHGHAERSRHGLGGSSRHGLGGRHWANGWRGRPDWRHHGEWRDINDWSLPRVDSVEENPSLYEWITEEHRPLHPHPPHHPHRRHNTWVAFDDTEDLQSPLDELGLLPEQPSDPVNTQKYVSLELPDTKRIPPQRPIYDTKTNSPMEPGIDWSFEEKPISRPDSGWGKKEIPPPNNGNRIIENLLSNLPTDSSTKLCPHGWHIHGPKCYIYVAFKTTWPNAEKNCLILGGNLASVHGHHQYRFLLNVIEKSSKKDQQTWIGANDAVQEGLWLWSDGSRFKYHNWSQGQPSNHRSQEHCMEMNFGADRGQNDAPCWYEFPFLCSRKL